MAIKVSEIIKELQELMNKHGDTELFHEDNSCNGYVLGHVSYDENEKCIRI